MAYQRVFGIVLDSVGTGAADDANRYDDLGSDTLGHIGEDYAGNLHLPNLARLGLSNLRDVPIQGVPVVKSALGCYGKMAEISAGKDSMNGHWKMMGLPVKQVLDTFPHGFPEALIHQIETFSGRPVIVNQPYSGTQVIHDYGEEQLATGALIVYTSGDSVLQIAAHEAVISVEELYRICEYVRGLVNGPEYLIGRVIARPYLGSDRDHFTRTANRRDFSLAPTEVTDLDRLQLAGYQVIGIGKINDIFSGTGINQAFHNESNQDGMQHLLDVMDTDFTGFCFMNLVDFDAMYGHRRDPQGFGQALMEFDQSLGQVIERLRPDDLLMITADHGNDPGFKGTDHTRENVPLLVYSPLMQTPNQSLGTRTTFADFGATILDNFRITPGEGESFYQTIKND